MDPRSARMPEWVVTATAASDYAALVGPLTLVEAKQKITELMRTARLAKDVGPDNGDQIWRTSVDLGFRRVRVQINVSLRDCGMGSPPQVIRIRAKER